MSPDDKPLGGKTLSELADELGTSEGAALKIGEQLVRWAKADERLRQILERVDAYSGDTDDAGELLEHALDLLEATWSMLPDDLSEVWEADEVDDAVALGHSAWGLLCRLRPEVGGAE